MNGTVAAVAQNVPTRCHATRCNKDKCWIDLAGAPQPSTLVDMDCDDLCIPADMKRCDYLFVGTDDNTTWVAPIELKSGRFSVSEVAEQLEGGARMADNWLPQGASFQLAPVLAHGKPIHPSDLRRLRASKLQLRGQRKGIAIIKCGDELTKGLKP